MAMRPSAPTGAEPAPADPGTRTSVMMLSAVVLLVLAVGLFGGRHDASSDTARLPPPVGQAAPAAPPPPPAARTTPAAPAGKHLPRSRPVRLLIPKISVDAPFTDLVIGPTGQLQPPPANDTNLVGWHAAGASPGEAGTAIIAGHVDTKTSAAVFVGLSQLKKGDAFSVARADRHTASFVVDSVEKFDKDNFPNERVYGDTPQAQVRLITCAGSYDRSAKDYTENLVVFAHLV
ncbi:class F sortase [Streptomyces sp. HUCO-GS316]|uniref:class F sortase n=1 Tax=Streptomyces sp. HUCO-GS316 TaxID=2692198 RepID=UPI00136F3A9D|nr:class F sortase [Streptomyces sp. HUCO-GS316]MXM67715.1 class F sortase [Streptomyces sp. HUCO-GS316]